MVKEQPCAQTVEGGGSGQEATLHCFPPWHLPLQGPQKRGFPDCLRDSARERRRGLNVSTAEGKEGGRVGGGRGEGEGNKIML